MYWDTKPFVPAYIDIPTLEIKRSEVTHSMKIRKYNYLSLKQQKVVQILYFKGQGIPQIWSVVYERPVAD